MIRPSLAAAMLATALAAPGAAAAHVYNEAGNILISDQFNNRVVEVAPNGDIVWQFGRGPTDVTRTSPVGVNDALRIGPFTLVSGTGAPPGTEPQCPSGCPDDRVMLVDQAGEIVWQYGVFGLAGAGQNRLDTPVQATWTPSHTILIADQANQRVIEVTLGKKIVWQYGQTGVAGAGPDQLSDPNSAELLDNGDVLIADEGNNRAIEVDRKGRIVVAFTGHGTFNGVAFASRLPSGNTLITDANNNRIAEVNYRDQIVWQYFTNRQAGSNSAPAPTRAIRLHNGDTLISDQFNHRVILINPAKQIVRQYGTLNVPGYSPTSVNKALNAPYDAKRLGDNTGLTWSDTLHLVPAR